MEEAIKSISAEATVIVLGVIAAIGFAIREAAKRLIEKGAKLGELRLEIEIARLEREKLDLAAAAGSRIAKVATMPASGLRGEAEKALAIEQAADLLGVSPHAPTPAELPEAVQAAFERDVERNSLSPDALTPAEMPNAKRLRRLE
jgi:hypothetical protein